jgi:UDPglucose 6-dehydrogenase
MNEDFNCWQWLRRPVSGAGLSEVEIMCSADIDAQRIEGCAMDVVPIFEPGLEWMLRENAAQGRLGFTSSLPRRSSMMT